MNKKYFILTPEAAKERWSGETDLVSPFEAGIPLVDLSDETLEQIYYFRWHTYCKHIKQIPYGYVITEFLPDVPWAGKFNTINCPAGHHFYEGRWLHDRRYIDAYARFWFTEDGAPRQYSFWAADSIWTVCRTWGDYTLVESLYEPLKANYAAWEADHSTSDGLFWQNDGYDGMEFSIGGSGRRPTINSYMYADAAALSKIAARLGKDEEAKLYAEKAASIREKINTLLWDADADFYKTRCGNKSDALAGVREEVGFIPWGFGIPEKDDPRDGAWRFLFDENHFAAPYGPTTAERCHPRFMEHHSHECLWNGPSWPFATSQTLNSMRRLLQEYEQNTVCKADYFAQLRTYARSHYITENGETRPFIDEDLDPFTGEWIARRELAERGIYDRGIDYNHSSFCDHVISGLAGVRPSCCGNTVVDPLFTENDLDYFCADGILCRGHSLTVLWDKMGDRYGKGAGMRVYVDGEQAAASDTVAKVEIELG